MGRRSRKRGQLAAPLKADEPAAERAGPVRVGAGHARPLTRRASLDDAPQPPWAPVPLTEIAIFVGLVVLGAAFLGSGSRGLLLGFGLSLVTIATLELALREHLAGFRSHSALLAGIAALVVAAPLAAFLRPAKAAVLLIAALVFLAALQLLRGVFRRRADGMSWRA